MYLRLIYRKEKEKISDISIKLEKRRSFFKNNILVSIEESCDI